MRGSYFDRSIELENILELPNESGSEADDLGNYDEDGLLLKH